MKSISIILLLTTFLAAAAPPPGYKLAWSDEFDGTRLDTNKWQSRFTGQKRGAAVISAEAVAVTNGCLTITSYTENGTNFTGMVSTEGKFEAVQGYWEARIKFAEAPGSWAAFWLQSPTLGRPVGDPGKAGAEVDICEHRQVNRKGANIADQVQHALHWDGYGEHHKHAESLSPPMNLSAGFHLLGCELTSEGYKFFVDGRQTWATNIAASNAREFAILSTEMRTNDWAGNTPKGGYGSRASSLVKMTVDYVRYYEPGGDRPRLALRRVSLTDPLK
jgi:beta-glucanase (GH16 family)